MYIKELLPIFILISVLIWGLDLVGIFQLIIKLFNPIIQAIGLPTSTTQSFILGFFRRDFGAAGILKIRDTLTGVQLLVASVTLTLFVPCIAQFIVMIKERGVKVAVGIAILSIVLAFTAGFLLNLVLTTFGVVF